MARTPTGFEITDFLTALSDAGQKDEKYDSFVRKFVRFRKREIKKENAEPYAPYRVRMMDSIAGFFMVFSMLAYFTLVLYMTLFPVIRTGQPTLKVMMEHMSVSYSTVLTAVVVSLLCASVFFKGEVKLKAWAVGLSAVWCGFVILTEFLSAGPLAKNSPAWLILGNLTLFYSLLILLTSRFGAWLHNKLIHPPRPELDIKHFFTPFEVAYLLFMIISSGICLPFMINLDRFYKLTSSYIGVRAYLLICPVLIFVIYCIWHANRMDGESVNAWFCSSMEVFAVCLILETFTLKNLLYSFFLWMVLVAIGIVIVIYLGMVIPSRISFLSIAMIILDYLLGAGVNYYSAEEGITAIGASAHWWLVVPAFVTIAVAIWTTIHEMMQWEF